MSIRKASLDAIAPLKLPGRDLFWLADRDTIGCEQLSVAIMRCPAHSVVKPLHSHGEVEEILLILQGEGEAWVDGETTAFKTGDAVLFPTHSKHQVRNTGDVEVVTASIFGCAKGQDAYENLAQDMFGE